jgi:2-dehydro-3-deoxyphosphogluconate aldolase/(4S)-4-hydroxy-2-oxoglutarate aldolase
MVNPPLPCTRNTSNIMAPLELMRVGPVIPVIVIEDLAKAVPLAKALVAGGVRVLEVTLRTPVALDAIRAIANEVKDAIVGVGTISDPADFERSIAAGARFGVSAGFTALKLFPAQQAGGMGMLKALAGPFPDVMFCPTGGVTAASAADFLALPNVGCVGGSWLTPKNAVAAGDWRRITALACDAAGLRPPAR